jgi:hypothetical protein
MGLLKSPLRALAGIHSCQSIKSGKVVRQGFLTTPEEDRAFSTVPYVAIPLLLT